MIIPLVSYVQDVVNVAQKYQLQPINTQLLLGVYKSMCECCHTEYKIKNKFEKIFMFNVKYLWFFYIAIIDYILISILKVDKDNIYILALTFVFLCCIELF